MKCKALLFICLFFISTSSFAQEENFITWESTYKTALKKAKKAKKPVLIYFTGSDWCGPCIKLDRELFQAKRFVDMANANFILYKADIPRNMDLVSQEQRKTNDKLRRKFKQEAFPTLIFVNHKGKMIAKKRGILLTDYYYPFFESVMRNYKR